MANRPADRRNRRKIGATQCREVPMGTAGELLIKSPAANAMPCLTAYSCDGHHKVDYVLHSLPTQEKGAETVAARPLSGTRLPGIQ
jgi:hypothetical protein